MATATAPGYRTSYTVKARSRAGEHEFLSCSLVASRVLAVAIPLTQGKTAFIDPEDAALVGVYGWAAQRRENNLWYAIAYVRGSAANGGTARYVYMHALVSGASRPDHIDRNGLNNTKINLRVANGAQNNANQGKRQGCSSRFKGVTYVARTGKWAAQLHSGGRKHHLGYFTEEEEAARVYDDAAVQKFGEFAATNAMLGLLPEEG
jgi:hypothetical protein